MIFAALLRALGQMIDPRFRRVVIMGVLLALGLLFAVYAAFLQLVWWLVPDSIALPFLGTIQGFETVLGWASLPLMVLLSVVLMVPVASAFTGVFLENVASAVEDRHYPHLPPAKTLPRIDQLRQTVNFLGVVIAANLLALVVYPFTGPLAPLVFWAMNGFLLGREYFTLVALRHLTPDQVRALRHRNRWTVWAAGTLMAAPLSVPLLNLLIPVLGVATFTHLFHRMIPAPR